MLFDFTKYFSSDDSKFLGQWSEFENCYDCLTHFWQKFRENNVISKEITKELI